MVPNHQPDGDFMAVQLAGKVGDHRPAHPFHVLALHQGSRSVLAVVTSPVQLHGGATEGSAAIKAVWPEPPPILGWAQHRIQIAFLLHPGQVAGAYQVLLVCPLVAAAELAFHPGLVRHPRSFESILVHSLAICL